MTAELSDEADIMRRKLHAQECNDAEIARRTGRAQSTIQAWRAESGLGVNTHTEQERFDEKWIEGPNECWVWIASRSPSRYGRFYCGGTNWEVAHRAAWRIYRGENPGERLVLHKNSDGRSHRRDCVNPDHLYLGDKSDNALDSHAVGQTPSRGSRNGRTDLEEPEVMVFHFLSSVGVSNHEIAKSWNVDPSTVSKILTGDRWPHMAKYPWIWGGSDE